MAEQELQQTAIQAATGCLEIAGETLTGIVVTTGYTFDPEHTLAAVTPFEVEPASEESRLTGTVAATLTESATGWLVTITGTTAIDLIDVENRGGIAWFRPNDNYVGFSEDIGGEDAAYLPTYPDGLYFDRIGSYDDLIGRTVATVPFGPTGDIDAETLAGVLAEFIEGGGGGGGEILKVGLFAEAVDMAGGSFSSVPVIGLGDVPRENLVGVPFLVTEGASLGIYMLTASGPCTPGAALIPAGLVVASNGYVAAITTTTGTDVTGAKVLANRSELELFALASDVDAVAALATGTDAALTATAESIEVPSPERWVECGYGLSYGSPVRGYLSTPTTHASPSTSMVIETTVRHLETDGSTTLFQELRSEPKDDDGVTPGSGGVWDRFEHAGWARDGVLVDFFEFTKTGGSIEWQNDGQSVPPPTAFGIPAGVWHTRRIKFLLSGSVVFQVKASMHWDEEDARGRWRTLRTFDLGAAVTLTASTAMEQWIGRGGGRFDIAAQYLEIDGVAESEPDIAGAEPGDPTITDTLLGDVWTLEQNAAIAAAPPAGAVDSVNGQTGTVVLDAADVGAQPTDADLTAIAALSPSNDDILQRKSGAWTNRTIAQLRTDLAIAASPTRVAIEPSSERPNAYTVWTATQSAVRTGGYATGGSTVGSESWTYSVPVKAGTWRVDLLVRKTTAAGIITCTFNGSSIGTIDTYTASNSADNDMNVTTSLTVAADGTYDLVLTNPTKNASSGGYSWYIQAISMTRTGS